MTENKRKEILKKAKPILLNTEMVRAILDGKKTVTRRVIKPYERIPKYAVFGYTAFTPEGHISARGGFTGEKGEERYGENFIKMPYLPGNILYVRETFSKIIYPPNKTYKWVYKATDEYPFGEKYIVKFRWHPSIHMPKEAARIFLRVTNVRVERLQDITEEQAKAEGFVFDTNLNFATGASARRHFFELWDKTIKKSDLDKYGWDANPWVWVIEFERID